MVRLRLRSGEVVPAVLPPESIQVDVEFVQRQIKLTANALQIAAVDVVLRVPALRE